jgi:amino acid adenylation domain-containing protein
MKAGGAYLPLDPTHPPERLQGIIEDAAPEAVLASRASFLTGKARAIAVDGIEDVVADQPQDPISVAASPEQLAYLLFTSGSTGRPKGVEITRRALANFLHSMARCPGLRAEERLLAITTTSFDIAELELFLPLWVGATAVIADSETTHDPRRLRRALESKRIDVMQATPATWRLLLEAGWRGDGRLRMLCGGEDMSPALADRLLRAGGELWNMYGPTEATVWSTLRKIEPGYDQITIGEPIDNTQVYVLDEALRRVRVGDEGELWIGGAGLARGYHGRPQLTSERFVQNPFGAPGDRIYRTGDLGRQLPDGRFVCLGRIDSQVKIRGFRIELGEISALIDQDPGVRESVVIVTDSPQGEKELAAYVVKRGADVDVAAIRQSLRRGLPEYMVPATFTFIDRLPLTVNGKLDVRALPAPERRAARSDGPPAEGSALERDIADIWRAVLNVPQPGLDQNFFDVGGNSIHVAEVHARLQQRLGRQFPITELFAHSTVRALAAHLSSAPSAKNAVSAHRERAQKQRETVLAQRKIRR